MYLAVGIPLGGGPELSPGPPLSDRPELPSGNRPGPPFGEGAGAGLFPRSPSGEVHEPAQTMMQSPLDSKRRKRLKAYLNRPTTGN